MKNFEVDIQSLSIGANGHIGFNEPRGTSFDTLTHRRLKGKTRQDNARFFDPLGEEVPTEKRHDGHRDDHESQRKSC